MEETVWVVIGIIAVIIALGAIVSLVRINAEENKAITSGQSLDVLLGMCNRMCMMPQGTYLSVSAHLVSDTVLKVNTDNICIFSSGKESCRRCECEMADYTLNLSAAPFETHEYSCFFLKDVGKLKVNCSG